MKVIFIKATIVKFYLIAIANVIYIEADSILSRRMNSKWTIVFYLNKLLIFCINIET